MKPITNAEKRSIIKLLREIAQTWVYDDEYVARDLRKAARIIEGTIEIKIPKDF